MPKMTGDLLARTIKSVRPDIPVILCTGFSKRLSDRSDSEFIDALLMKPADKATMAKTMRRVLDGTEAGPRAN